jgi:AcrR family transcriptional regulator
MARQRLSRAESKVRTRTRLLDAAVRVFRKRGYRGATVEEIASEAGYTIGALYSNFAGKDDLLLALLEHEIGTTVERIVAAAGKEKDASAKLRRGALEWIAILDEQPELYVLLIEFWTLWVRDPKLRPEHAQRFAALRQAVGDLIAGEIRRTGSSLRVPPEQVGAAVVALADGLALQRLADPKATPDDLLASLLEALIPALSSDATRESPPASP